MPTYSYICKKCDNVMEIFQKMDEPTFEECHCEYCRKKQNVKRVIKGGTGMIFKGSGFYLTDYTDYRKNPDKSNKQDKNDKKNDKKSKEEIIKKD